MFKNVNIPIINYTSNSISNFLLTMLNLRKFGQFTDCVVVHREYDLASYVTKSPVVTCVLSEEIELYIFRVILRAKNFFKISKV